MLMGEAYGKIGQYLGVLNEVPIGPPFAAYYNDDMQDLDVAIGFPVARVLEGRDEIQAGELPGGRIATCVHTGPYSEIEPAYDALSAWVADQGLEPTGVAYEFYLNDPQTTPPEDLQTRIVYPLT
jgi:effector-binding domain-containing protein